MYKEFDSLDALYQEIEDDKNWTGAESSLRNRYPIRFILFENFGDFDYFVQACQDHGVYVQSIDKWMKDGQDDKFITYSHLADLFEAYIKNVPSNDFVIAPFSEITRFYDNVHYAEFDSLLKTIRLIQSPEEAQQDHQRIYVPIIGMQSKVHKFKNDPNIHIWEYRSGEEYKNYQLILTHGTTYGVRGLENEYTLCADLRRWIALWKNVGANIKTKIICSSKCIFNNAGNAQPDNAFEYTVCNNAFEFLTKGLGIDMGNLSATEEDLPYWEQLAADVDITDFHFEEYISKKFNVTNINDENTFVQTWFDSKDDFSRWLLKTYFLWKETSSTYLTRVLAQCKTQSSSELFSLLATQIFDEPTNDDSLHQRLMLLREARNQNVQITELAEQKVKAKLTAIAADPERGYYYAMKYMSPLTRSELGLMIKWVGGGYVEATNIQSLFPALHVYLSAFNLQMEDSNAWVNGYFKEYCHAKVANQMSDALACNIKEHNASQVIFETWRDNFKTVKTILHNRQDIDKYYWIDGLGVDWIPFITKVIEKHNVDGVYLNEIHIGTTELPTVTSVNKAKLEELSGDKLEKIGDLDKFAHAAKSYPEYLLEEFDIVEKAISTVLSQYNGKKIAFVSDHGISYMAQFGSGLNLSGIDSNHAGRCAQWAKGTAPSDSNYVIGTDGQTLCALNTNSLAAKTPIGQGAHGGALPEEVLVPVIIVSDQKNASHYTAQLKTAEIAANNPVVDYIIKGLSSIDTPYIIYNGVEYALHKVNGNTYASERLNLVDTSTMVTLCIGEFKQTDKLSVNTGVQEDDLFDF